MLEQFKNLLGKPRAAETTAPYTEYSEGEIESLAMMTAQRRVEALGPPFDQQAFREECTKLENELLGIFSTGNNELLASRIEELRQETTSPTLH